MAASHILRPVTGVSLLVVKKASDAKLLGGRSVPASPVPGAGGLVSEDAVEPVAVLGADGRVVSFAAIAIGPVGIVANANQALPPVAGVNEAVGAKPQNGAVVVGATVQLVIMVAIFLMRQGPIPSLAIVLGLIEIVGVSI